jgi:YidC/Oxa1 family membrane protein insertase
MEERRLIIAIAVSIAFFVLWQWLFPTLEPPTGPPPPAPVDAGPAPADDAAPPGAGGALPAAPGTAAGFPDGSGAATAPPTGAIAGALESEISVETPLQVIRLTNRGARVTSFLLPRYHEGENGSLELVSPVAAKLDRMPLQILVQDPAATARLNGALYRVERSDDTAGGTTITSLTFTWSDGEGLSARKVLRIPHDSYLSELEVAAQVGGRPVDPTIVWGAGFGRHSKETAGGGFGALPQGANGVVRIGDRVVRRPSGKIESAEPWVEAGPIAWAGLEDKYFAALLVPESQATGQMRIDSLRHVEEGRENFFLSFALQQPGGSVFRLFVGPKDFDLLSRLGYGLERILDFGHLSFIALPLFHALKFVDRYTGNFGWAIVLLTIVIRIVFFPFMHRGQLKMRLMQEKMKRVQPKVKAMRERYRKLEQKEAQKGHAGARYQLRQKMNQEMMELYKQEDVNPLGSMSGCLPLLAQMPILFGFYTVLSISIELRGAPFAFGVKDLSEPNIWLVIIMGVTMLAQQMMTSSSIPDPAQRRIMYIMPVMFTYFFISFPAGLVLYWLVNNLLGIVQQYLINREADAARLRAQAAAG